MPAAGQCFLTGGLWEDRIVRQLAALIGGLQVCTCWCLLLGLYATQVLDEVLCASLAAEAADLDLARHEMTIILDRLTVMSCCYALCVAAAVVRLSPAAAM